MMWTCPICKTTNDTYICTSCGFDASRDYINSRSLCPLPESASKIFKPAQPGDNILMASSDTDYVFGRKMDRKQITTIYFRNKKENIGEDAWDVSEKQNGSIMAWTEKKQDGLLDLYIAANGNITANRDCSFLFSEYTAVKNIWGLEFFKTDQTENMKGMFENCYKLQSLDVSHFFTSQVKNMKYMFASCSSLKNLDVSYFDTSQVTDLSFMFYGCSSLENLDVSRFITRQVTDMKWMFAECGVLEGLDVSHFATNQVKDMKCMFYKCDSLESLDVSHFVTDQVTDLSFMFAGCGNLKSLAVSRFATSRAEDMQYMFGGCKSLKLLNISNFDASSVKELSVPLPKYLDIPQEVQYV